MRRIDPTAERGLVFDWPARYQLRPALALLLALSLGIHVGALAVFQIVYPDPEGMGPRPAEAALLIPGSEQAGGVMPWLLAADPALMSRTRAADRRLFEVEPLPYRPSYATGPPTIDSLPRLPAPDFPSGRQSPGPVQVVDPLAPVAHPREFAPRPSVITLLDELDGWEGIPAPRVAGAEGMPQRPTEFLAAAVPGAFRHLFLLRGSGVPTLDDAALTALLESSPTPPTQWEVDEVAWGRMLIHWGTDIHAEDARP